MSQIQHAVVEILDRLSPETAAEFSKRFVHPKRNQSNERLLVSDLNTFWRIELTKLPQNTIEAREALISDIPSHEWLDLFDKYVAPVVVAYWPGTDNRS